MRCIFIYNPNSGKGKIKKKLDYLKEELNKMFDEVVIHSTVSQADTIETAKKACSSFDTIIFSGGDGTFNDIAYGVSTQEKRPILGYIPSGTVNDIARNLKIPKNIKKALKVIKEGNIVNHDIGTINDQYFVYVAAIGTFTSVSYATKQKNKKVLGRLAYVLNGLNDVINPSLFKVKLTTEDGRKYEIESPLVLVVNSISVGGIPFNKSGHLNDGKFDIIIVKKHIGKGLIAIFNTFILGVKRSKITKYYEIIRSSKFEFEIDDNITWALDGQRGMSGPVKIENKHNHLQIFVPFKYNKPRSKYLKNK